MVTAYVSDQPVSIGEGNDAELPISFELKQNFPNPFNPSTKITYQISEAEKVNLEIYNALGEKVRTLVNDTKDSGQYEVIWDGKNQAGNDLSSGVYFYRLDAGKNVKVMKMVLLR